MMHPMMVGGGPGGKLPFLLLALAAGYAVLVLSNKQERPLDVLGRFVGGLILIVSFVGLLCAAISAARYGWTNCKTGAGYPFGGPSKGCFMPMGGQAPVDAPADGK